MLRLVPSAISRQVTRSFSTATRAKAIRRPHGVETRSIAQVTSVARLAAPASALNYDSRRSYAAYSSEEIQNQVAQPNLYRLVEAYRRFGHLDAYLDPLNLQPARYVPELELSRFGFEGADMNASYNIKGIVNINGKSTATLGEIIDHLKHVYATSVGVDFVDVLDEEERIWLANNAEEILGERQTGRDKQRHIFSLLARAEAFDHFMGKKFGQVKRYGAEGAESMMVAVDAIFEESAVSGVEDTVIGIAHRGRLNLLVGLLDYPARQMFSKIKGASELPPDVEGCGDVLSHLAQSVDLKYGDNSLHVSLLNNPSHLEAINPVAAGKVYWKQEMRGGDDRKEKAMPLLIHGDAAFAGQGVVNETFHLANLKNYSCGGTVHLITNNQVGFTATANVGRSSCYSSDQAKSIRAPIITVNGEDPEAVVRASKLAVAYRQKFGKDIVIDLIGYRRHGHNEVDEPSFTQPQMYKEIRARKTIVDTYGETLKSTGVMGDKAIAKVKDYVASHLDGEYNAAEDYTPEMIHFKKNWEGFGQAPVTLDIPDTGVHADVLKAVGLASIQLPEKFSIHPRLKKGFVEARRKKLDQGHGLDWATCEALAWGSLLREGYNVRISGQDVERGTFSHRHVMLTDQKTGDKVCPLADMPESNGLFQPSSSHLSEFAVMGFEYGISVEDPKTLAIWEAQFGDFFNGAQIIIDTFINSGESKWLTQSGMTIMLPHGFDGAGPEHSSARIERWLQLCDGPMDATRTPDWSPNMSVIFPTTPANYFHAIRRQMVTKYRKPLIVIGPKTMLRDANAVSDIDELQPGTTFKPVLGSTVDPAGVKKVVLCSGKIYYDLEQKRAKSGADDVAIVRLEELHPFPAAEVKAEVSKYTGAEKITWVQEEPENAGAWSYVAPRLESLLGEKVGYVGRIPYAAPATGLSAVYKKEQKMVVDNAFA
eukprot:GFYU01012886.1.p1 GENE.GFYU01012886.1~~GFYU01012886.1.p1  ORF type:complete len:936 (+),score=341.38 GFYU01012886.1:174-2981(+)